MTCDLLAGVDEDGEGRFNVVTAAVGRSVGRWPDLVSARQSFSRGFARRTPAGVAVKECLYRPSHLTPPRLADLVMPRPIR